MFALEMFGFNLGSAGVVLALVVGAAVFLLANRAGAVQPGGQPGRGGGSQVAGAGDMQNCRRCSAEYQVETVELLPNGNTRRQRDEKCPQCGWALSWGEPGN